MTTAVLFSAGLDSAVLAASEARNGAVQPIYVSAGLAWEPHELAAVDRLLSSPSFAAVTPIARLDFTAHDLYPSTHWALRGEPPGFDTPDEDVYLTGRNIMLLSKAGIYCAQHDIDRLSLGPLAGNPFPDATPEFFATMGRALSLGLAHDLEIATPLASMHKADVITLGVELGVPLELTLSCMNPSTALGTSPSTALGTSPSTALGTSPLLARHCGRCSKCRERRDAFAEAGVADPTSYAVAPLR